MSAINSVSLRVLKLSAKAIHAIYESQESGALPGRTIAALLRLNYSDLRNAFGDTMADEINTALLVYAARNPAYMVNHIRYLHHIDGGSVLPEIKALRAEVRSLSASVRGER